MMKLSKYILTILIVLAVIAAFSGCKAKPSDDPDLTENKTTNVSHLTTVQNDTDLSRLQKTILDAQYGENTYSTVHVTTEYYEKDFFVTYANRGASDTKGLLVKLEINNKNIKADDPFIKELLDSLKIVMA